MVSGRKAGVQALIKGEKPDGPISRTLETLANNYPTMVNNMEKLSEQNTVSNNFTLTISYLPDAKKLNSYSTCTL